MTMKKWKLACGIPRWNWNLTRSSGESYWHLAERSWSKHLVEIVTWAIVFRFEIKLDFSSEFRKIGWRWYSKWISRSRWLRWSKYLIESSRSKIATVLKYTCLDHVDSCWEPTPTLWCLLYFDEAVPFAQRAFQDDVEELHVTVCLVDIEIVSLAPDPHSARSPWWGQLLRFDGHSKCFLDLLLCCVVLGIHIYGDDYMRKTKPQGLLSRYPLWHPVDSVLARGFERCRELQVRQQRKRWSTVPFERTSLDSRCSRSMESLGQNKRLVVSVQKRIGVQRLSWRSSCLLREWIELCCRWHWISFSSVSSVVTRMRRTFRVLFEDKHTLSAS